MITGLPPLFFQFEETIWIGSVSWNVFLLQLKSHCDDFLYTFLFWIQSLALRVPHSTRVNARECSQDFLTTLSDACFILVFSSILTEAKSVIRVKSTLRWKNILHDTLIPAVASCFVLYLIQLHSSPFLSLMLD